MLQLVLDNISYFGIVALLIAGVVLPIPEEFVVIAAGFASHYERLDPTLAFGACLLGALCGDCLLYALGYYFGHGILRDHRYFGRFLRPDRELQTEQMILRHGLKVLFAARFLVGLRSTAYVAAGVLRIPFRRFILVDICCASIVIGTVFGLSYAYASKIENLWTLWDHVRDAEVAFTVLIVAGAACLVFYYWRRHRRRVARIRQRQQERAIRQSAVLPRQQNPTDPTQSLV